LAIRTNSIAFRLVAGAAFWIAAGLFGGAFLLSTLFRDYVERSFDARLAVLWDSLYTVSRVDTKGHLQLLGEPGEAAFDQAYSGWYWQISKGVKAMRRSRSLWDRSIEHKPIGNEPVFLRMAGPDGQDLRVLAQTVLVADESGQRTVRYTLLVAGDRGELEAEIALFNRSLVWSLGGLGLLLVIAVFIQVRFGILPLRRIPAALAAIRSGRSERLTGQFSAEVEPLAEELNKLIDHNREVVERARTHVGNLAHALKTPLAVLANESAGDPSALAKAVHEQATLMQQQVDHHLARARAAARVSGLGARTEVAPILAALKRALARIHRDKNIDISTQVPDGVAIVVERQDVEEMLGNLMDNACKWAKGRVEVHVELTPDRKRQRVLIRVEDDGPGLEPAEREKALERGERLDEATPGSGLGLSIVRDLVEAYEGSLKLESSTLGGLRVEIDLPAAG
jgi:signal transduction histidine kinase